MPEFQLDASGSVARPPTDHGHADGWVSWADLDSFTQGYVEALFFTSGDDLGRTVNFVGQAWVNDYAVTVDDGGATYVVTAEEYAEAGGDGRDEYDELRHAKAAPAWVQNWDGPFEVYPHSAPAFRDLSPEALASIIADCAKFQGNAPRTLSDPVPAYRAVLLASMEPNTPAFPDEAQAGRDFLYTRNGHGCGFWDGDWPEPYASELDAAAKAFGEVSPYLGDDGRIYV